MPRITNWLEVEKRLANYSNTLKSAEDRLVKTNDSLNLMLNSLIINLKDLLESQSDISLWFYDEDEPTTSNQPYISWTTPSDHYGDFFYSRTKGLVYQFTNSGWNKLDDATLLNALALTNAKLESGDHERKIFLDNPVTPYESGDWWIREDGTLYICQISRASGKREENDYIDALKYAQAVAKATDNLVEVLRGTMITTTDSAVVYEDKASHKTTTISGDSIRTGEIISNNYVHNSKGTKISLNDGTIDSKNFKVSNDGTITATNGNFSGTLTSSNGTIGGFTLGQNSFTANLVSDKMSRYTYSNTDRQRLIGIIMGTITPTTTDYDKYDFTGDGELTSLDLAIVNNIINGTQNGQATITLDTKNSEKALRIKSSSLNKDVVSLGLFGSYINVLTTNNLHNSGGIDTKSIFSSESTNGNITTFIGNTTINDVQCGGFSINNNNGEAKIYGYGSDGELCCVSLTQTSKEEDKKNFEKLQNGLDIIKDIDIYKYNMKVDKDDDKKHIGFVIGNDFKYREEVTAKNNNGVDVYSFVSVCCKAIQEQQEQIEDLKEQLEELKNK